LSVVFGESLLAAEDSSAGERVSSSSSARLGASVVTSKAAFALIILPASCGSAAAFSSLFLSHFSIY